MGEPEEARDDTWPYKHPGRRVGALREVVAVLASGESFDPGEEHDTATALLDLIAADLARAEEALRDNADEPDDQVRNQPSATASRMRDRARAYFAREEHK